MSSSTSFPMSALLTLIALAAVLLIAWLALKLLAKSGAVAATSRGGRLRILQSLPLGTRERIVLVDVDGETWVLGVTAGGITRLDHSSENPIMAPNDRAKES